VVLFESPRRLGATLSDLAGALGPDRRVAVARELTKLFEAVWRGSLAEAAAGGPEPRGEQVIVIGPPASPAEPEDGEITHALRAELERGASRRDAAATVAGRLGVSRRRAYGLATRMGKSGPV
jgi:16S rRNA (cytidine1402-2'-O)-methyltransferase